MELNMNQIQEAANRFDQLVNFGGKEVKQSVALNQLLNSSEFKEQLDDTSTLNEFIQDLNNIINNSKTLSDDQISDALHKLTDNPDYWDITGLIENNYSELYKIFNC